MIEADITGRRLYGHRQGSAELLYDRDAQPDIKHTYAEMAHFLDCIEAGKAPLTDGPGSLQGLRAIWRMYRAEQQGGMANLRGLGLDEPWEMVHV
jgi:hypothetical protein